MLGIGSIPLAPFFPWKFDTKAVIETAIENSSFITTVTIDKISDSEVAQEEQKKKEQKE